MPVKALNKNAILVTVSIALMAVVSAVAGLNVALPAMAVDIQATQTEITWIVDSYTVVFAGLLLLVGAIGDRYGRKYILAVGLLIFGGAASFGLLVDTPNALIAVRSIMGLGAAAIMPSTLSVISASFEASEKGKAVGVWVGVASGGAIIGLFGTALLLEFFSWSSFFALNVGLALISLIGTWLYIPESKDEIVKKLDWTGGVLSVFGIGFLVFGIIEGPENGWGSAITIISLLVGALSLVGFVWWELRNPEPLLDPRLFKNKGFSAGSLSITVQFFGQFGFIFVGIQYLQIVAGFSALEAAIRILPMAFVVGPVSRLAGKWNKTIPQKYLGSAGMLFFGIGLLMMAQLTSDFSYTWFVSALLIFGFGIALAATPATTAILNSLSEEKQGVASAVNDTSREFGSALGIAILGSALNDTYRNEMSNATEGIPNQVAERIESSVAFTQVDPPAQLAPVWDELVAAGFDAFASGMNSALTIGAIAAFVTAALVLWIAPSKVKV